MKKATTGTLSGCIVWIVVAGLLTVCMLPVCIMAGSITSFSSYAIQTTGRFLCPDETTPQRDSYATTTTDEYGNRQPATAYVLQCVDEGGSVVKEDPVIYAFSWVGGFAIIGLILAGILALVLAAPAGVMIGRLLNRGKKSDFATNVEV